MFSGNGELSSQRVAGYCAEAERKGFEGLWFGETTLRDASILAAIAACNTKRAQLGTAIVNVFTRGPGQLALMGATLNELSGGRFTLGLGVSTAAIVEAWHGQRFDQPIQRLDETVKLLRKYFSGERFSEKGRFYSPTSARLKTGFPPKIALAALNTGMLKKASTLADRIILNLYPPDRIKYVMNLKNKVAKRSGKSPPTLSAMLYAHVLGDDEKGLEVGKDLVSFYASAPAYSKLFSSLGYDAEARKMAEAWKAKDREAVRRTVSREMISRLMVVGTVSELRERVKAYHDAGVDDVMICPSPFGDYESNFKEVIQHY